MRQVTAAGNRFRQAHGLPAVLDAACDAFEAILTVIGDYEDTTSTGTAFTLLLVATQAANGRDALLFAPPCHPAPFTPWQRRASLTGREARVSSRVPSPW